MGKKSRRKGGKATKPRKEQSQQRRERAADADAVEAADEPSSGAGEHKRRDGPRRTYFEGDRVWFVAPSRSDGSNPNTYRGIVRRVRDDTLDIVPFQSKLDGHDAAWDIDVDLVFPDFCDLTLRFDVGDRVLCHMNRQWLPREVNYLWPIYECKQWPADASGCVPVYKCDTVGVPWDSDECIMKHPSSFRFSVGDHVIFDVKKAIARGEEASNLKMNELETHAGWCRGTVTGIDMTDQGDYYTVYECSFESRGRRFVCHILRDDDEHVAGSDANP